jgi:NAD(P)-dependent dehydrogenase (short-subunit alcohol dehydrogenase family)
MKALVVGSSGTIGSAVSNLLKEKGYEVTEASRSTTPPLDITDSSGVEAFYSNLGEVDAIICVAGDAAFNFLDKISDDEIQLSVNSKLLGQVNLVRKGLNNLLPGGVFVITGGILAYTPSPQTSIISLVNAGLEGFVRAVALELTDNRRIAIVHPPWVAETAARIGMDPAPWPDASKVAEAYLEAIEDAKSGVAKFVTGYVPESKA